jgi:hypothetical protein
MMGVLTSHKTDILDLTIASHHIATNQANQATMDKGRLTFHSNAVNLARRLTELNENDLMMVSCAFVFGGRS